MRKLFKKMLIGVCMTAFLINTNPLMAQQIVKQPTKNQVITEEPSIPEELPQRIQAAGQEINAILQKYRCMLDARVSLGADGIKPEIRILGVPADLEPPEDAKKDIPSAPVKKK